MKNDITPSKQLSLIDPSLTKMIRIEGNYMYSNPSIDVVFDAEGNFYSNKKNDGYKVLQGKKVHYMLNANGIIVKGNTTKASLLRTLLGSDTMPEFKVETSTKAASKQRTKDAGIVAKTKAGASLVSSKKQILTLISNLESDLAELKKLVA